MIEKLIGALPVIKEGFAKGAALAAYVVDAMKDLRKYDPARDPWRSYRAEEISPEIQALTKALQDLRSTILIAD